MKNVLFWILFPFLIPQALYVRKTAPRFASAAGPNVGTVGSGKPVRLLAIGDSIIAGVGASTLPKALVGRTAEALAAAHNASVAWQALGVSGYNSTKILEQLVPKIEGEVFDYVVVSVGVNDITGLTSMRNWRRNLASLIEQLRRYSPTAIVAIAGMPPLHGFPLLPQPLRALLGMRARAFDAAAKDVIKRHDNTLHVPLDFEPDAEQFADDGYHPSEVSYAVFGQRVADSLLQPMSARA